MQISDIEIGDIEEVSIEALHEGYFNETSLMQPVEIRRAGESLISIESAGNRIVARVNSSNSDSWISQFADNSRVLAALVAHDGTFAVLRVWSFSQSFYLAESVVSIILEDELLRSIAELVGSAVDDQEIQEWLRTEFLLHIEGKELDRFVLRTEPGSADLQSSFVLIGKHRELDVKFVQGSLYAVRIAPKRSNDYLTTVLVTSKVVFSNSLVDEEKSPLAGLLNSDGYLQMWDRYGEAELAEETDLSNRLGTARYTSAEELPDGTWRFKISGSSTFLNQLTTDFTLDARSETEMNRKKSHRFSGGVISVDSKRQIVGIRPMTNYMVPPDSGMLQYAIGGSTTVHKRRKTAFQKIANAKTQIPELAAILEMKSARPKRIERYLKWDSPAVRSIFKGSEPTDAQKRAIEVALNTPDIAIIQGPPGTGKTQVISAIAVRVAEEMGEKSATRQVLLSSFQHEAVDNVASRTLVFGLPTVKESAGDSGRSWLKTWRFDRLREAKELFEQQEQGVLAFRRNKIIEVRSAYVMSPVADSSAGEMLEDLVQGIEEVISASLLEEVLKTASQLRREHKYSERSVGLVSAIRGVRTNQISHADDGKINAIRTVSRLKREMSRTEIPNLSILEQIQNAEQPTDEQFAQVEKLRNELLDLLAPSHIQTLLPSRNNKVIEILNSLIFDIDQKLRDDGKGLSLVLTQFIHDLEADPKGVESCLGDYAAAIAATCQGAGALAVRPGAVNPDVTFNTVIIDEAARANPLDLQIPMSIASRRVILVGDQRQLPHIVDQKIAESVVAKEQEQSELEESLFGRLYRFLENERRNGLPNRVVTLNKQFRMHPELGNFVSKNFYELYGETIESPRPALEFQHGIPAYEGKFAVWIDVPSTQGREEKVGTSWIREAEARVIAKEAKRILESNPKTTLCVISFYKKQVDLILEMLLEIGVASRDPDNGSIGIYSDHWRITTNESGETVERFRVDTVDSFQGKEFDVSMLSAVRTPDMRNPDPVRAFGHLGTMNRLCVALSRQRKLLILVGDRQGLADHPLASTYINPIRSFSQLCLEPQ